MSQDDGSGTASGRRSLRVYLAEVGESLTVTAALAEVRSSSGTGRFPELWPCFYLMLYLNHPENELRKCNYLKELLEISIQYIL